MKGSLAKDLGLWALYYPVRWGALALPVPWVQAAGRTTGRLHGLLRGAGPGGRLRRNMEALLGPDRAPEAARDYLVRKHQTLLEHFLIASRGRGAVEAMLGEVRGREHLDATREAGKGAVLAQFHFGNIRMLAALGHRGYPLVQLLNRTAAHAGRGHSRFLARRVRDQKIRMDRAMPARFVHWEPGLQARAVYRVPREGELLLVHLDGSRGSSFLPFDFLGGKAPFATGAARIAWRMGVPLIPVFCVGRRDGRHDLVIEPPVDPAGGPVGMTARCVSILEGYVRRCPEQWWTWARLQLEADEQGGPQFELRPAAAAEEAGSRLGVSP